MHPGGLRTTSRQRAGTVSARTRHRRLLAACALLAALVAAWYARPAGAAVPKPEIDLQVTKSASAPAVKVGDSLTYSVEVRNAGPSGALAVVLDDTLPPGLTIDGFAITRGACVDSPGLVSCVIGPMLPGDAVTLTIDVTVAGDAPRDLVNECAVRNDEDPRFAPVDVDPSNDTCSLTTPVTTTTTTTTTTTSTTTSTTSTTSTTTTTSTTSTTTPPGPARLSVALTDADANGREPGTVPVGGSYRYVFTMVNTGGEEALVERVRFNIPRRPPGGVALSVTDAGGCRVDGPAVECAGPFRIPPDVGVVSLSVTVRVGLDGAPAGTDGPVRVVGTAEAFLADGSVLRDLEPTTLLLEGLQSGPSLSASATSETLAIGEETSLSLEVANPTAAPLAGVDVAITVPPGLTLVGGPAVWQVPRLPPGGSATSDFVIRADEAGRYLVVAEIVAVEGGAPPRNQGEGSGPGRAEVVVSVTGVLGDDLLAAAGSVFADDDADGRRDAGEAGLRGIALQLLDPDGGAVAATLSGDSGRYAFPDARPGQRVEVMSSGYVLTTPKSRLVREAPIDFGLLVRATIPDTGFDGGRAAAGGAALLSFGVFLLAAAPRGKRRDG